MDSKKEFSLNYAQKNYLAKTIIAVILGVLIIVPFSYNACNNSSKEPYSSVTTDTPTPTTPPNGSPSGDKPIANCSHDVTNLSTLAYRIMTYKDSSGTTKNDYIRLRFDRFPDDFNKSTSAFEIFTFAYDSAGTQSAAKRVAFRFERYSGNGVFSSLNTTAEFEDITWSQLQQLATSNQISVSTAKELMASISLAVNLKDSSGAPKLLAVVTYDGNTILQQSNALIPSFYANPADYAVDHPAILVKYHPLRNISGGTAAQYTTEAQKFCF